MLFLQVLRTTKNLRVLKNHIYNFIMEHQKQTLNKETITILVISNILNISIVLNLKNIFGN